MPVRRARKINPGRALKLRLVPKDLIRLLGRVKIDPKLTYRGTPCWIWQGWKDDHGYGRVSVNGRNEWTHRAFVAALKTAIPAGREVDHACKRPSCCNPAHLRVRTMPANRADVRRIPTDDIPF